MLGLVGFSRVWGCLVWDLESLGRVFLFRIFCHGVLKVEVGFRAVKGQGAHGLCLRGRTLPLRAHGSLQVA